MTKKVTFENGKIKIYEEKEINMNIASDIEEAKKILQGELSDIINQVKSLKKRAEEIKFILKHLQ